MVNCNAVVFILIVCMLSFISSYVVNNRINSISASSSTSISKLLAHHPQKKIIKKKQDKRPKKHRLSDINRSNINLDKCITKVENAPAEYTLITAAEYEKVRSSALLFWENGSPTTPWITVTEDDMMVILPNNREPLPEGGVPKRPKLVRQLPH